MRDTEWEWRLFWTRCTFISSKDKS